ncbi:MAG: 4Fe-4S dicluster domain-containing protein [Lachnospiraceae bacterium]|nr:4Fe-4S dicluster domain-containing protein [Lachnospiraceae bacterium]
MSEFFTSVHLDESKCKGCINCIKRCPTEAIRVRNGKAVITTKYCIDCGECIRQCKNHAKLPTHDSMDEIKNYKYTVALPAPSLYAQVNNLDDIDIVLTALKDMGFDDVFEVSHAAEIVSALSRKYIPAHKEDWPIISTACPSVTRLIRVRFPNLIDHLLPIKPPMEIAAEMARKRAIDKTGLPSKDIGIFFLSPCPAKVTSVKSPLGYKHSDVDCVLSIKDIYPKLIASMKTVVEEDRIEELSETGNIGISWGSSGGEAGGLLTDSYLAADGIENVLKVLEDLEDQKFANTLSFIELNACHGGCVGGVLAVENPFLAKVKLKSLRKYIPIARTHDAPPDIHPDWEAPVQYEPVFTLGDSMIQSLVLMKKVDELTESFPGLDCGSCGAPTCRALAEDIVRGNASEKDCIHIFKQYIHKLSDEFQNLQ